MSKTLAENAAVLTKELEWLSSLITVRLQLYFKLETSFSSILEVAPPKYKERNSSYVKYLNQNNLSFAERAVLILCLAPAIKPQILDGFLVKNTTYDKRFSEFGGHTSTNGSFLPTVETALFLLAGEQLQDRLTHLQLFQPQHPFLKGNTIQLVGPDKNEGYTNSRITISDSYIEYFITGNTFRPRFSETFPARLLTTALEWQDVVYDELTAESLEEIIDWVKFGETIMAEPVLAKRLRPGYKALFYGPPGTGKTTTAALLGKATGLDVYKIDLSMVVSKYIGETEKNLSAVFDTAENKNWILFFDEADALFGKRTEISNSNDRYANQEVAYLLQRIEDHNGIIILASNLKDNIDTAFSRRFQNLVYFPLPAAAERYKIWQQSFSSAIAVGPQVDLQAIAEKYTISGGLIMNVIRSCSIKAVKNKTALITSADIETAIRKELQKEGILIA